MKSMEIQMVVRALNRDDGLHGLPAFKLIKPQVGN